MTAVTMTPFLVGPTTGGYYKLVKKMQGQIFNKKVQRSKHFSVKNTQNIVLKNLLLKI